MIDCPLGLFFTWIHKIDPSLKYNQLVLLSVIKLLDAEERKFFFAVILQNIHVDRIERVPKQLLILEIVTVEEGYYVLDSEVRRIFLEMHTRRTKDIMLVQTSQLSRPAENEVYSLGLFKTISVKNSTSGTIRRLMAKQKMMENGEITHKGFNFLLETRKNQMWMLILAHLQIEGTKDEILGLAEILTKDAKRVYLLDRYEEKTKILDVFKSLGLASVVDGKVHFSRSFSLLFDESTCQERFLILESNFRMYIYGESQLNIFILSLFTIRTREFPNLIVATITEESVKRAFELGITAQQLCRYLQSNSFYAIDVNVLEQIQLWERRRKRIFWWESYLFNNFLNHKDFLSVVSFCKSNHIEYNAYKEQRILIVGTENYETIKAFIKQHIK
ncbi:transcription initiation factor TFIIH subunit 4 [Nematocida homosporus]|uniref:transcription initiation factor TFIIH subunit 4 n=1 Tax=Nematocida homosporus TaxID=1912981 RepID=UPI002220E36F|nr:transcription initiation factor TFIIH subunit 4 [Nematocida homosporus]KAI5187784.1 transcription initiation factor TFIIH subunit 4 [Nematocida homosporus]